MDGVIAAVMMSQDRPVHSSERALVFEILVLTYVMEGYDIVDQMIRDMDWTSGEGGCWRAVE